MLILAGAGDTSMKYYAETVSKGINIDFVIDNNPDLNGVQFFNHIIRSPAILNSVKDKKNTKVVITALKGYDMFKRQVMSFDIPEENITRLIPKPEKFPFHPSTSINDITGYVKTFNEEGANCMLGYGTLLGLVREGKILPHDDDVDIWVMDSSLDMFTDEFINKHIGDKLCSPTFLKKRVHYLPDNKHCSFSGLAMKSVSYYFTDGSRLKVDFFLLCRESPYYYTTTARADLYRLPMDLFTSTTNINVGDCNHIVPSKYDDLLTFIYGDWRIPVLPEADGKFRSHSNRITDPNSSFVT